MNKILAASLIAAVTSLSTATATQCGNGGFYMGATVGASFNKASVKFDKNALNTKLSAQATALAERLKALQATADTAFKAVDSATLAGVVETIFATIDAGNPMGNLAPASGDYEAGSLGAYYKVATNKDTKLYKLIDVLYKADNKILDNVHFKTNINIPGGVGDVAGLFTNAIATIAKAGNISQLSDLLTTDGKGNINFVIGADSVAAAIIIDTTTYADAAGTAGALVVFNTKYTPYKKALDLVATTVDALKTAAKADATDADASVVTLFYSDAKKTTALSATGVATALTKYTAAQIDAEMTEIKANANGLVSKKATGFLFGANFGFDHRINDVMLGVELEAGMEAGGKAKIRDNDNTDGITVRRQFYVSLMPRVGYLFAPQFEGFLTFGGSLGKYKADTSLWNTVFNHMSEVKNMADAVNTLIDNKTITGDKIDTTVNSAEAAKVYKSHSKTKFVPVIGAGVRYEITPEIFATLAYNFAFKTKIVDSKTAGAEIKFQSHILKAGVGFRF